MGKRAQAASEEDPLQVFSRKAGRRTEGSSAWELAVPARKSRVTGVGRIRTIASGDEEAHAGQDPGPDLREAVFHRMVPPAFASWSSALAPG